MRQFNDPRLVGGFQENFAQLPNADSLRNVQNVGGDANRDVTVGINRPITQIPPAGVSVSDTTTPPPPITTRDVERQLNTDSIPPQPVPTWASETFGFTQDNWNQMRSSDKNALYQKYTLLVENREVPPAVSNNDSVTAPPRVDTSIPTPAAPLQKGDSGYEWDAVNDRRADPVAPVLLPSAVNIDADPVTPGNRGLSGGYTTLRRDLLIPPTEEFENQSASQRVMDTVPPLAPGERQEHLDTGVTPYPSDTAFTAQDIQHAQPDSATVTPETTVDEPLNAQKWLLENWGIDPSETGLLDDRFALKSSDERMEAVGISPGETIPGGPFARTQMQILPGMSEDLWNKLTAPIAYGQGQTPISQAISLLEAIYDPLPMGRRLEIEGLSTYAIDLMKAQGATQEEIDKAKAEFRATGKSRKKQEQIDQYMALDDNVRALVEGRWRPGVENFDLVLEADAHMDDPTWRTLGAESQLPPEETVEEVVQAPATTGLTPRQQMLQELEKPLEAKRRGPPQSPIAFPPEPLPKIDFSRDEVRPEEIRPLTKVERAAAAVDSLLQKPGMAKGMLQLGTSLLQGEGAGVGLEELSGEITSANDVIREQEQLAEEEAKAQGKREAFGGLLQEIVEGPPEGVDPQKWQGLLLSEATEIGGVEGAKVVQEFFPTSPDAVEADWELDDEIGWYDVNGTKSYGRWMLNTNSATGDRRFIPMSQPTGDGSGSGSNKMDLTFSAVEAADAIRPYWFAMAGLEHDESGNLVDVGWKDELITNYMGNLGRQAGDDTPGLWTSMFHEWVQSSLVGNSEQAQAMRAGSTLALQAINPIVRALSGAQMTNKEAMRYFGAVIPTLADDERVARMKYRGLTNLLMGMSQGNKEMLALATNLNAGADWDSMSHMERQALGDSMEGAVLAAANYDLGLDYSLGRPVMSKEEKKTNVFQRLTDRYLSGG
jgi:hypothetical protein